MTPLTPCHRLYFKHTHTYIHMQMYASETLLHNWITTLSERKTKNVSDTYENFEGGHTGAV